MNSFKALVQLNLSLSYLSRIRTQTLNLQQIQFYRMILVRFHFCAWITDIQINNMTSSSFKLVLVFDVAFS